MSCLSHNEQFDMQTQNRTLKVKLLLYCLYHDGKEITSLPRYNIGVVHVYRSWIHEEVRTGLKREMCHQHRTASMTSEYRIWDSPAGLHAHYFYILHMSEVYR